MDLTPLSLSIKVFELEFDCDRTHSVARRLGDSSSITHRIRTPLLQTYDLCACGGGRGGGWWRVSPAVGFCA